MQRYTNHDLVKYLESIGAEFGACQNAYTSADDTVYEFQVPTDDDNLEILDRSFDVFAEFATKIRCTSTNLHQHATQQCLTLPLSLYVACLWYGWYEAHTVRFY